MAEQVQFSLKFLSTPLSTHPSSADPPYFLSNDGITCQGGKMVSVNKGSWDKLSEGGTSVEEKHKFNRKWIRFLALTFYLQAL